MMYFLSFVAGAICTTLLLILRDKLNEPECNMSATGNHQLPGPHAIFRGAKEGICQACKKEIKK